MSLYVIGDLHLSLGEDKPMDVFAGWNDYVSRLEEHWHSLITDMDTVVIAGDISWAMKLEDTYTDFKFIDDLPGKKLLLKGNHDYWWGTKSKMEKYLTEKGLHTISVLFNNAYVCGDYAAVKSMTVVMSTMEVRMVSVFQAAARPTSQPRSCVKAGAAEETGPSNTSARPRRRSASKGRML